MYSLGINFGGDSSNHTKRPCKPGSNKGGPKCVCPEWNRGVIGCFVCGRYHRDNSRHSREEVTEAVNKLKARHPQALLTVEYLVSVVDKEEDSSGEDNGDDYEVHCISKGKSDEDSSYNT